MKMTTKVLGLLIVCVLVNVHFGEFKRYHLAVILIWRPTILVKHSFYIAFWAAKINQLFPNTEHDLSMWGINRTGSVVNILFLQVLVCVFACTLGFSKKLRIHMIQAGSGVSLECVCVWDTFFGL